MNTFASFNALNSIVKIKRIICRNKNHNDVIHVPNLAFYYVILISLEKIYFTYMKQFIFGHPIYNYLPKVLILARQMPTCVPGHMTKQRNEKKYCKKINEIFCDCNLG